jgi:hypothetical protein
MDTLRLCPTPPDPTPGRKSALRGSLGLFALSPGRKRPRKALEWPGGGRGAPGGQAARENASLGFSGAARAYPGARARP